MSEELIKYGSEYNQRLKETTREKEKKLINTLAYTEEQLARTVYPAMTGIYDSFSIVTEEATESLEHTEEINRLIKELWTAMRQKDHIEFRKTLRLIENESMNAIEELLQLIAVCRKSLDIVPKSNFKK